MVVIVAYYDFMYVHFLSIVSWHCNALHIERVWNTPVRPNSPGSCSKSERLSNAWSPRCFNCNSSQLRRIAVVVSLYSLHSAQQPALVCIVWFGVSICRCGCLATGICEERTRPVCSRQISPDLTRVQAYNILRRAIFKQLAGL